MCRSLIADEDWPAAGPITFCTVRFESRLPMPYLITYDIAHPRAAAPRRETSGKACNEMPEIGVPDSHGVHRVRQILDEILPLLKPSTDCVQAWELARGQSLQGMVLGNAQPLEPRCVVSEPSSLHFIEEAANGSL